MKRYILLLIAIAATTAAKAPPVINGWAIYNHGSKWSWYPRAATAAAGDIATFNVTAYDTFLTKPQTIDLRNKTITVSGTFTRSNPSAELLYCGQGTTWNPCPTPVNFQGYFSTKLGAYDLDNSNSSLGASDYWFCSGAAEINYVTSTWSGTVSMPTADFDAWNNGSGVRGSTIPATFSASLANCKQIGITFTGGCFGDMGVYSSTGDGTITFHLKSFSVQ